MERDVLFNTLKTAFRNMSLTEFAGMFINQASAIEEFYKLCNGFNTGNTISLLFNPHRLSTDNEKDDISVFESLQYDDKLSGLARLYLYNLEHGVTKPLYSAIQRGYQNIQYINEFQPYVARDIYKKYGNSTPLKVLDPCSGWGGRMIGCASIPNTTYVGFEPSTQTYEGLLKLGEWLKTLQPTFNFYIYKMPYEDSELTDTYDVALTSPPYYDTEHYSTEMTNSLNRYNTFDKWVDGFYEPLIVKTVNCLGDSNPFIINIGDRRYPLTETLLNICDKHGFSCKRVKDYLSGNGPNKEKFFVISKKAIIVSTTALF